MGIFLAKKIEFSEYSQLINWKTKIFLGISETKIINLSRDKSGAVSDCFGCDGIGH